MRRLAILEVCTSRSWGGMEMQALHTATKLRQAGHDVTFLCQPGSQLEHSLHAAAVPVLPLPFGRVWSPRSVLRLRRELGHAGYQLAHVHFSRDLSLVVPAAERRGPAIPIVLTKHVGSYIRKRDLLHRYLYSRVSLVTAVSRVIRDNVIETCPIEPARVRVLYSGVDLERFSPSEDRRERVRAALRIAPDEILIGMVGRFSPGKGHEEFLNAAAMIRAAAPGVRFVVVGGPSYGEEAYAQRIRTLQHSLGLDGPVEFTGFRNDVPDLMAAMDIMAVPSYAEAFGNVAAEAMAMARPVVATDRDGMNDIVVHGVTGIQVPARDSHALADALLTLVRNVALRERLGRAGRARVEESFDEKKQLAALVEQFVSLIGRPASGTS